VPILIDGLRQVAEHDVEQLLRQWPLERPGAEAGD